MNTKVIWSFSCEIWLRWVFFLIFTVHSSERNICISGYFTPHADCNGPGYLNGPFWRFFQESFCLLHIFMTHNLICHLSFLLAAVSLRLCNSIICYPSTNMGKKKKKIYSVAHFAPFWTVLYRNWQDWQDEICGCYNLDKIYYLPDLPRAVLVYLILLVLYTMSVISQYWTFFLCIISINIHI